MKEVGPALVSRAQPPPPQLHVLAARRLYMFMYAYPTGHPTAHPNPLRGLQGFWGWLLRWRPWLSPGICFPGQPKCSKSLGPLQMRKPSFSVSNPMYSFTQARLLL